MQKTQPLPCKSLHKRKRPTKTLTHYGFCRNKKEKKDTTTYTTAIATTKTTTVADCHVKYLRPAYQNLRAWMDCPDHVYVGRKGVVLYPSTKAKNGFQTRFPPRHSVFANHNQLSTIAYRNWIQTEIVNHPKRFGVYTIDQYGQDCEEDDKQELVRLALMGLKGKTLGCWCVKSTCARVPKDMKVTMFCCHAQILAHMVNTMFP